jgi:hypothetical protein
MFWLLLFAFVIFLPTVSAPAQVRRSVFPPVPRLRDSSASEVGKIDNNEQRAEEGVVEQFTT